MQPYSTLIPNVVFDEYLPKLKLNELKVFLIVLRQTIGFRKVKDWISSSQMEQKTGLSKRSISHAIDSLVEKKLIHTTDDCGRPLRKAVERKGRQRIYFSSRLNTTENNNTTHRSNCETTAQNLRTTKENYYKNSTVKKNPKYEIYTDKDGYRIARMLHQ